MMYSWTMLISRLRIMLPLKSRRPYMPIDVPTPVLDTSDTGQTPSLSISLPPQTNYELPTISVCRGNITQMRVDVIVNSASETLRADGSLIDTLIRREPDLT